MNPKTIVDSSQRLPFLAALDRLWERLTAPSETVTNPEQRRQAQLLATLLFVVLTYTFIDVVAFAHYVSLTDDDGLSASDIAFIFSLPMLVLSYGLSRTRHYLTGAALTLVVAAVTIYGSVISAPNEKIDLTSYLVLSLLIGGIMFSLRTTVILAIAYSVSAAFVLSSVTTLNPDSPSYALMFLIVGSAMILTFMRYRDLTEADRRRVLAEARDELRASRELYRTLAQNLPRAGVILFDHDLRFVLVEGAELGRIGFPKEDVEGKTLREIIPPEHIDEFEPLYRTTLEGGESVIERRGLNGEYYLAHYVPIRDKNGAITAAMTLVQNVHEQKNAEQALRESEERYRLIAENATDLISVQTPAGVYLYASPASRLLLGYRPDELVGKSVFDFVHEDDKRHLQMIHQGDISPDEILTIAYRIRRKDGTYTWFESASRLVHHSGGSDQIITASRDISERMRANEALRHSEEQLRSLIASMANLVFSIDLNGRLSVYHPMPQSIYDTPVDTAAYRGKHYRDVLPDALAKELEAAIQVVTHSLSTQQIEYSTDENGEERFFSARISPMIDTNLRLLGSTVVVSDMTDMVRAQQREQKLLAMEKIQLEISAMFLASDDADEVINDGLRILGEFFDVSRAYVLKVRENERLLDNTHEWCAPGVSSQIQNLQSLPFDELFPSLLPMLVSDGIIAPAHISELPDDVQQILTPQDIKSLLVLPLYVDDRLEGMVGFNETRHPRHWLPEESAAVRAFTQSLARVYERQRAQHALVEARDAALRSAKLKSDFVSNMSHEIRTPMTGVIGMLDLLRETNLSGDQGEFVEIAHNSANRLLILVNDILDFSKIEAGKIALENIPLDVRGVITEVQSILNAQAVKKQLEVIVDVDEDVPARVLGDPTRLRQILMNLVGNAIKFTEQGSVCIRLRQLNTVSGRARLRFEVSDTGIGIAPERQNYIFDSFVQADSSTTRRYGGAGLGLAICKQLVTLMNGELDLESTPDEGSTFGFTLTMPIVALAARSLVNSELKYLQVMVVDADSTGRYVLAQQIRQWGTDVIEASTQDEALELLVNAARRAEEVEIVLIRQQQPAAEQAAFAEQIRSAIVDRPPTLVQLYDDDSQASAVFDVRLRRPVRPTELRDLLLSYLDGEEIEIVEPLIDDRLVPSVAGRILVADDEPMSREIVIRALEQFGYTVDMARNGQEVLDMIDQHNYRLILLDIHMPVIDGLETTRIIRSMVDSRSKTPIVALTASVQPDERQTYLDAGISAIIGKPFSLRELRDTVEVWAVSI